MIRVAILDDEPHSAKVLEHKLRAYTEDLEVIHVISDPLRALAELSTSSIDLLFLDVEMPHLDGFQFLEKLGRYTFEVVFTTAHNHYTLEALRISAIDFLLKPIDDDDLAASIHRIKEKIGKKTIQSPVKDVCDFSSKKVSLSTLEGVYFVDKQDVVMVEAMSNYCTFYLADNRKIVISKTLKEFEAVLSTTNFIRINRSSIININYVTRYKKGNGGTIEMNNGAMIEVSPQKKNELWTALFGLGGV